MTIDEYQRELENLRVEYSESIKDLAASLSGYALISRVEIEAAEYHTRVSALMNRYQWGHS